MMLRTDEVRASGAIAEDHHAVAAVESDSTEHGEMTHAYLPQGDDANRPGIKTIQFPDELPDYIAVISAPGQPLEVRAEDQRHAALISHGQNVCSIIYAPDKIADSARRSLELRAQQNGYEVRERFQATVEVIVSIYTRRDPKIDVTGGDTAVARYLTTLLQEAIGMGTSGASDIHIRVRQEAGYIYLRVDNDLRRYSSLSYEDARKLSNAMYNSFAAEKGKKAAFNANECQDAQIVRDDILVNGRPTRVSMRYSGMPLHPNGWKIVLRILPINQNFRSNSLEAWGFSPNQVQAIMQAIARPIGATLACGPTGAGKSTTQATALRMYNEFHAGERQIYTIEDPVEAVLPFADQLPVTRTGPEDKQAFARALSQVLRSDPDCIMVQELRDSQTVELFAHATETGHKTLGTVHATTPFQAIERLVDLGLRRQLLTSPEFVNLIFTQRLISLVCPHCSRGYTDVMQQLSTDFIERLAKVVPPEEHQRIRFRGPGCAQCAGSGKAGRTAVVEMMVPHPDLMLALAREDLILAERLWRSGEAQDPHGVNGMTYRDHAIQKIRDGIACPVTVEKEIGWLTDGTSRDEARDWMQRHAAERSKTS